MIVFESELYAEGATGVLPFKIIVEEDNAGGIHRVTTRMIRYRRIGDRVEPEEQILNGTFWKENGDETVQ